MDSRLAGLYSGGHGRGECSECGYVTWSCRCFKHAEDVVYVTCDKCKDKAAEAHLRAPARYDTPHGVVYYFDLKFPEKG